MLFLLTVLLIAVTLGRGAAVLASVLSVLLFDIFFVPPRFSLAVSNIQYLVTFAVMLATGLITGQLAAGLKQKAHEAEVREQRTQALYESARQLAGALTLEQVATSPGASSRQLGADAAAPARTNMPTCKAASLPDFSVDPCCPDGQRQRPDGAPRRTIPATATLRSTCRCAPRCAPAASWPSPSADSPRCLPPENLALLEALASLVAIALERLHYVDVAQSSQLKIVSERLRSSILSALSHDLRTPLTALVGLADSLFLVKPPLPRPRWKRRRPCTSRRPGWPGWSATCSTWRG
jgi:two-component system sensor histidine kinase KdpD